MVWLNERNPVLNFKTIFIFTLAVTVFGCGSSDVTPPQDFIDNMPTADTAGIDQNPNDISSARSANAMSGPTEQEMQALTGAQCHPHLFLRTRDAVRGINRYIVTKFFKTLDAIIDSHASKATSSAVTWTKPVFNGAGQYRVTLTKSAPGQYALEVAAKAPANAPDSAYVVIQTATINNTGGQPHAGTGTMHLDLTALASVFTAERARGTIDLNYTVNGNNKKIQVTLTGFTGDDTNPGQPPANSNYVFARTKGVGGSFKYVQNTVFACPENPTFLQASLKAVHRWKVTAGADGGVAVFNGRSDANATGGQMSAGQKWVGVTCTDETAGTEAGAEKFWQMAVFDANGNLLRGEYDANGSGTATCDSSFGAKPSGSPLFQSNYNLALINFTDASVVTFPGMPSPFP